MVFLPCTSKVFTTSLEGGGGASRSCAGAALAGLFSRCPDENGPPASGKRERRRDGAIDQEKGQTPEQLSTRFGREETSRLRGQWDEAPGRGKALPATAKKRLWGSREKKSKSHLRWINALKKKGLPTHHGAVSRKTRTGKKDTAILREKKSGG